MNIFGKIGGWLNRHAGDLNKLFGKIEHLIEEAEPIVSKVSAVVGAVSAAEYAAGMKDATLGKVADWLKTLSADTDHVETFVKDNANVPLPNLLHNASVAGLKLTSSAAVQHALSDIDLAVQTAYSKVKMTEGK